MVLALGFITILGVCLQRFLACACVTLACEAFPWRLMAVLAVSGSFAYYACGFACPRGFAWLSVRCFGARVLSTISPPSSPYSGESGLLLYSFSIELTVQCNGCLIWGLVFRAGLVAGLRVRQAYGVIYRPGFGLLVPVPKSLSTQPPFVTQALSGKNGMFSTLLISTKFLKTVSLLPGWEKEGDVCRYGCVQ